jgi:hypothetical protein
MKTFKLIGFFVFMTFFGNAQPTWVTFTDDHPSKPIIQLNASNNQLVKYNVIIPGMYSEIINNGVEYQRLSIPGGANVSGNYKCWKSVNKIVGFFASLISNLKIQHFKERCFQRSFFCFPVGTIYRII